MIRLKRDFFTRYTPDVARDLLGMIVVRQLPSGERLRGRIVETEAYRGADDGASHARKGKTPRTLLMFGQAGHAYIYLIYGMYHLLNATTEEVGAPGAVLIRAVEPIDGVETMATLRQRKSQAKTLTNGPGKLCQAMAIDRQLNGEDLIHSQALWFEMGSPILDEEVALSARIGIGYADEQARERPWRFFQKGNQGISK